MRGRALCGVIDGRRLLDVLASVHDAVGCSRVDACEVDVGIDGAQDETEEPEHQHGNHAARDERLATPVRLSAARCRRRRLPLTDFRSQRHLTHQPVSVNANCPDAFHVLHTKAPLTGYINTCYYTFMH